MFEVKITDVEPNRERRWPGVPRESNLFLGCHFSLSSTTDRES